MFYDFFLQKDTSESKLVAATLSSLLCPARLPSPSFAAHATRSPSTKTLKVNSGDPTAALISTVAMPREVWGLRTAPEVLRV